MKSHVWGQHQGQLQQQQALAYVLTYCNLHKGLKQLILLCIYGQYKTLNVIVL